MLYCAKSLYKYSTKYKNTLLAESEWFTQINKIPQLHTTLLRTTQQCAQNILNLTWLYSLVPSWKTV